MCGICGKYSPEGVTPVELRRMAQAIAHRGPDDEGYFVNGRVGLGNRRLSIIDLDRGRMPLSNEDGTIWITYNGEIYNFLVLRRELEQNGHVFKSNSDTEVIVHLYEELGERCVERLRGMFAFAIWDEREQKLFLARDQLGQKPLFYAQVGDAFLFASEVKAILASGDVHRQMDIEAMHHYLTLRFIPAPRTMLCDVYKLPPAHFLVFQDGRLSLSRYWDLSFADKLNWSEADFVEGLREKVTETVASHLTADVPLGAFLSGGMDSSMIVAMMAGQLRPPFKTFAVGVQEQDFNELPYARLVAERYNTCHVEQSVEAKLINLLPRIVWHLDEPSDPIAACMYQSAELAAQHVKVVLGGDGGDELFAGFDRYLGLLRLKRNTLISALVWPRFVGSLFARMPDSFGYKSLTQKVRWVHQLAALNGDGERYAEATSFFRFDHAGKRRLFRDALWRQVGHLNSALVLVEPFERANAEDLVDKMLYTDFMTRLPEHSLMLTDRMTMAHSLEARSPFLDHGLVEFLAGFPSSLKIRDRQLKYVLRKLAVDYLPPSIVRREKQGFMFPMAYWFQGRLNGFIRRSLLDSHFVKEGLFNQEAVLTLVEEHRTRRADHHVRLWMLLNLEVWYRLTIKQQRVEAVSEWMRRHANPEVI